MPQRAPCRLQAELALARQRGRVHPLGVQLQIMRCGEYRHELGVGIRLRPAGAVVQLHHRKHDAQFAAQLEQQPQQRHRIRPAGNRHAHAVAGAHERALTDCMQHALGQGGIHR